MVARTKQIHNVFSLNYFFFFKFSTSFLPSWVQEQNSHANSEVLQNQEKHRSLAHAGYCLKFAATALEHSHHAESLAQIQSTV